MVTTWLRQRNDGIGARFSIGDRIVAMDDDQRAGAVLAVDATPLVS